MTVCIRNIKQCNLFSGQRRQFCVPFVWDCACGDLVRLRRTCCWGCSYPRPPPARSTPCNGQSLLGQLLAGRTALPFPAPSYSLRLIEFPSPVCPVALPPHSPLDEFMSIWNTLFFSLEHNLIVIMNFTSTLLWQNLEDSKLAQIYVRQWQNSLKLSQFWYSFYRQTL